MRTSIGNQSKRKGYQQTDFNFKNCIDDQASLSVCFVHFNFNLHVPSFTFFDRFINITLSQLNHLSINFIIINNKKIIISSLVVHQIQKLPAENQNHALTILLVFALAFSLPFHCLFDDISIKLILNLPFLACFHFSYQFTPVSKEEEWRMKEKALNKLRSLGFFGLPLFWTQNEHVWVEKKMKNKVRLWNY